jgi:urease accessory protein
VRLTVRAIAGIALICALPADAQAHLVNTRLGDFYGGLLHPVTDAQTVALWSILGALAALQGPRTARWLIGIFPIALLAGAALSILTPGHAFVPMINVAFLAALGLMVAAAITIPLPIVIAVGAGIGLLHGYENGAAMTASTDWLLFICGLTAAGYVFVTMAMGLVLAFIEGNVGWRLVALRAGGSWVAAVGIMVLGLEMHQHAPV